MDELWVRLALVGGALLVAGLATLILRARSRRPRRIVASSLEDGVHFFSSATCSTCRSARSALIDRLGEAGFREHEWEAEPGLFSELGIEGVPASLVVSRGSGVLHSGQPDDMLASL